MSSKVNATTAERQDEGEMSSSRKATELNVAFETLESMRKANLELEFAGVEDLDPLLLDQYCAECLHEETKEPKAEGLIWKMWTGKRCTSPPCFVCGTPVCKRHSCETHGLYICERQCKPLLNAEDLMERLESVKDDREELQKLVSHMMDSYDRSLLLLRYACQFENLDELADSLDRNDRTHTQIQLGGSGMGFMSGVTGVGAVAAKITVVTALFTPVGPALLAASIALGGTAAAATIGHELAIHRFSKSSPEQQRYHKLMAWYAVASAIATVLGLLLGQDQVLLLRQDSGGTDAMTEVSEENSLDSEDECSDDSVDGERVQDDNNEPNIVSAVTKRASSDQKAFGLPTKRESKHPLAGLMPLAPLVDDAALSVCKVVSDPNIAGRMHVAVSQASTSAVKMAQYASVACGALSAFTIWFEARNMRRSLERLEGPCTQAEQVRNLPKEVLTLPDTKVIAEAIHEYLKRNN